MAKRNDIPSTGVFLTGKAAAARETSEGLSGNEADGAAAIGQGR